MINLWRLAPRLALAAALLLILAGVGIGFYNERTYRIEQASEAEAEARILAATVTAALTFDDGKAAQEYVSALRANPEVLIAAVYDASGALFARYAKGAEQPPATMRMAPAAFDNDRLAVTAAVTQDGKPLGLVYLRTLTEPFARRLERYGLITLLVIMAAVVVVVLGAAQATLSRTNISLAQANTDLRAQIEQRQKAEDALRQAQKMEAIGHLTGGVAHDFNNLLQVILGSLEAVKRRLDRGGTVSVAEIGRPIDVAMRGGERAASLTRRLLAFARRQPLMPKPLDLRRLVLGMSDLLRRTLGEAIKVETVLQAGLWRVLADANQLENSLLNLAVNARDAMPKGGTLTLEMANVHLDESYAAAHDPLRPGPYVMVAVADDGVGMTPDTVSKAFDPFFTTKEVGEGTGLGLSQVYGFVTQSGGHVKIDSEPGHGTTVRLYLPRHGDDASEADAATAAPAVTTGKKDEMILVVEDDRDVRACTVAMLRELGYAVLQAGEGQFALQLLEANPEVRLLFTDVGLPGGLDGRQLADAARRMRPGLSVLYTTGYARTAIMRGGGLDVGVDLIAKPFTHLALAAKIRSLLDRPS
jgi:signal transduction histidine kinase